MVDVAIVGAGQTKYGNHQSGMKGMWAEAANNAATGGAMVPTLALGIPGSATTAVILTGLIILALNLSININLSHT